MEGRGGHLPVLNEIMVSGWGGGGGGGGVPRYNSCDSHFVAGRVSGHPAPGPSLALTCRPTKARHSLAASQSPPGGFIFDFSNKQVREVRDSCSYEIFLSIHRG